MSLPTSSPTSSHPQPSSFWGAGGVGETALMLCEHCLAVAKALVCYQHVLATNTKHSTMRTAVGKVDSIPARPNTLDYITYCLCRVSVLHCFLLRYFHVKTGSSLFCCTRKEQLSPSYILKQFSLEYVHQSDS